MNKSLTKCSKKACAVALSFTTVFLFFFGIGFSARATYDNKPLEEIKKIDPFYPEKTQNAPYTLTVPTLDNRLTVSADGKTATLFAPYVTKEKGWYDANKNWRNDMKLCWAASCSNLIAWYLDANEKTAVNDVSKYERDNEKIFNRFKDNWLKEGYDYLQGMSWYFTGKTTDGATPPNLINENSGGYLKDINHVGDTWSIVDINNLSVFGSFSEKHPFVYDENGMYYEDAPLYNYRNFSKTIIGQLHYGATALMVGADQASASSSHAITLWGCEYDITTGLIKKLYVTDSDDEFQAAGRYLKELKIKPRNPDSNGIRIEGYYLQGNASPISKIMGSMVLYSPDAVNAEKIAKNDIDINGFFEFNDYKMLCDSILGKNNLTEGQKKVADYDKDGAVDVLDAFQYKKELNNN